jgi:hypothetical protein
MNKNDPQPALPVQPHLDSVASDPPPAAEVSRKPTEFGGPKGPEPTRYGDWEKAGRCIDF